MDGRKSGTRLSNAEAVEFNYGSWKYGCRIQGPFFLWLYRRVFCHAYFPPTDTGVIMGHRLGALFAPGDDPDPSPRHTRGLFAVFLGWCLGYPVCLGSWQVSAPQSILGDRLSLWGHITFFGCFAGGFANKRACRGCRARARMPTWWRGDMTIREGRENEEICVKWSPGPRSFDSAAWHDLSHSASSDST